MGNPVCSYSTNRTIIATDPNTIPKWAKWDEASSYYLTRIEKAGKTLANGFSPNPTWNDDVYDWQCKLRYLVTKTVH